MGDETIGWQTTDYDPFQVSLYPPSEGGDTNGLIIVEYPWGPTWPCGPSDREYWDRDPDEIVKDAIRAYCRGFEHPNMSVVGRAYQDAEAAGVTFDGS